MSAVYHKLVEGNLTQDWSNSTLLSTPNDWSSVPSIQGFSSIDGASGTGVDPQSLTGDSQTFDLDTDVITTPSHLDPGIGGQGGVADFEDFGIVGLGGGGTSAAPNLVMYLDTTGIAAPVTVKFDVQDLDGSVRDSQEQLNVQYRIGETGPWSNVPGGYFADVTAASATPTTHISLTLPPETLGQAQLQVRIMTTDATGRDEWVGIDNIVVACFLRGTQIRTPRGEMPVETLSIGDEILTHNGRTVPVKWIGRRSFPKQIAARNSKVVPVAIRAGALADNVPVRDLRVSPEHAIFFDGVLVPAVNLVNGRTIVRELTTDVVEYFHIEIEGQAIVYADGAPAETYVNHDNRKMFVNWPEYVSLYGEDESRKDVSGAFERGYPCVTSGPALETIRGELDERSQPDSALAA
jgi:hypothetical protein